ncbi:DUF2267 domain-containing protein [Croceicoccus ponticola]|uniref:DUF2267 domain-containing protein n=1 Tax=Croceicoccus ponticola TaxID=2217664 RepID=A0A437H1T0_9SPHN|nr:DUF2267 domain-containing protein [Croceicoccus ponticola]RVQ69585.1 DUF2267 domain-containing protein [Croceicoccus ponticola]
MSTTGLDVFDKTIQTTNIWLDEITQFVGPDRHVAWKVLSTVLHKLRDRLQPDLAAHLAAQLPLMVRGVYYDLYQPAKTPTAITTGEEFLKEVSKWMGDIRPVDPKVAVAAVFAVLERHVSAGEIAKVRNALPHGIRALWVLETDAVAG